MKYLSIDRLARHWSRIDNDDNIIGNFIFMNRQVFMYSTFKMGILRLNRFVYYSKKKLPRMDYRVDI